MATDNRKIQIETEVVANTDALQKVEADFKRAADTAVAAGQKASAGLERMGDGADNASGKVDRATKSIVSAVQRTTVAMEAGGRQTAEYYKLLAQQRGADPKALEPYLQKLREVEAAQRAASGSIQQAGRQLDQFGNTAKQTAAALRQVPAQFTDIVVSLQGGTAPLTVLLQQGGQLRDVFGGIAPAAQALGNYIRGLINPMTALAAAAGVLAVGFFKGTQEAQEFQKAIILTGNAAGATAGQMAVMAARIDGVIGTQAKAAEVLALLANTGAVGVESFERLTKAAIAFERAGGGAVEDVVKNFAALGKDPLQATLKLNESMNFLTRSTYEQIRSLEEQGRTIEAAKVAQDAYAASLEKATPQLLNNLGLVERAWAGLKDIVKETGDAILSIGRAATPETQLEALRQTLRNAEALRAQATARGQNVPAGDSPEIRNLREQIALLEKSVGTTQAAAQADRDRAQAVKQAADFDKEGLKYRSEAQRFAAAELEIRNKYSLAVREGYISEQQLLDLIAAKRKEIFKDTSTAGESQVAQLRARRTELEQYLAALRTEGTEAKKLTEDEKTRNKLQETLKGNLSDAARAQAVLALQIAEQNTALAQSVRLEEERVKALKKSVEEYDRLIAKTGADADAILTQAQAQEAANAAMGKSKTAIAEATLEMLKQQLAEADSSDRFAPAYVAALNSKVEAQKRFVAALKETDYKEVNERSQEFLRNSKELERVYQDELKLSGLTSLEREKIVAQRQIELKYAKEIAAIEKSSLTEAQKAQQQQILDEAKFREVSAAVNKVIQDDFSKTADQINQSLTDALMRGFEAGKSFAQTLKDTVVNMFKTMVLRPVVQAIVNPVALTLTSALGLGSNTAQAATGGSNLLGTASTLSSAYNLLNTGVSTAIANGFGKLAASSFGQSIGLSTQIAGPVSATGQAATQLTSTGQTLSAGLGIAGNALAGYGLQKAISGGYKTGESGLVDAITVAASAYFGPIAGVVAGVFNRAFGRKLADMGITGEFGGTAGFTGENFTFERGGWFRSDRTRTSPLDAQLQSSLSSQFKVLQTQTALMADTLGLGTDAIANFTKDVKLSFMGLSEEQITQKIKDEFEALSNDLAKVALGTNEFSRTGENAVDTLSRLANSLLTVNSAFDLLGYKLYDASLAGADAASSLADLFGGLDAFKQATASYYESFYSEAEKLDTATRQISKSLSDLGVAMPVDKLAYRLEVEKALAAGNEELFASLIKLAPAFAEVTDAVKAAQEAAQKAAQEAAEAAARAAKEQLQAIYEAARKQAEAASRAADQFYSTAKSTTDKAFDALSRAVRAEANRVQEALTATYEATVKTINAQKEAAQAAQEAAQQNVNSIRQLFDLLENQIADLLDAAGAGMTAAQGRAFIDQAIATAQRTGYLPEQEALSNAIAAARGGLGSGGYTSAFEQRRDRLLLANQLVALQDLTDTQLSVAEQQLEATVNQIERLDEQLTLAKDNYDKQSKQNEEYYAQQLAIGRFQLDALRDIDSSVLSVEEALAKLTQATAESSVKDSIAQLTQAIAAEAAARSSSEIAKQEASKAAAAAAAQAAKPAVAPEPVKQKPPVAAMVSSIADWQKAYYNTGGNTLVTADGTRFERSAGGAPDAEFLARARKYMEANTDVLAEFRRNNLGLSLEGFAFFHYDRYGSQEGRAFAKGGYYPGGLALVGEKGPEIINFSNPGMVYNAEQTSTMLGSSAALVDEVRALREDNKAQARAMVQIQARMTKLMERWDSDGVPETRAVA